MLMQIVLIIVSFSSMYALGLSFHFQEIKSIFRFWKSTLGILLYNFAVLPGITFWILNYSDFDPEISIGIFLAAAAPGGASAAIFVLRAKGNPAFGGLLIILLNLFSTVITPILFALYSGIELSAGYSVAKKLLIVSFLIQGLPLIVGIWNRAKFLSLSRRLLPIAVKVSNFSLAIAIGILVVYYYDELFSFGWIVWSVILIVIFISIISGLFFYNLDTSWKASISVVTSVRSLSLALLLSEIQLKSPTTLLVILVYGFLMYLLTELSARIWVQTAHKNT
ncbi:bile acid:sodium symporter [Leptospira sp. GIMC2001]|uniref:bile acid:sodium symporter n=1 Tax=Leptospira sp. GIMC2001 TaxID=1513297 RepID=UPI00234974E8|nr:bile acid:sodium symporter [Leptospira sp. GIMC2001]WCL47607.1 bile acid:sodium symporter [Leptospira sp. GIMC2001]